MAARDGVKASRTKASLSASPAPGQPRWRTILQRARGTVIAVAAVGAVLSGLVGYWTTYRTVASVPLSAPDAAVAPLSILVLPFANQTGDDKKAYIADALTTSITTDLSRIRDAFVVPAATAFTYKAKTLTVQQVGKDAAVRFILVGSVMASGQEVRVTAQLVDTKTSKQLWNETFRGDLSNLFALQDQVTTLIGNTIGEHMVVIAARESEMKKSAPQVVDLLLRARAVELRAQSIENFREIERLYREVLSLEPNNLNAMARLAATLAIHSVWIDTSDPRREKQMTEARDLALKVKAIDPSVRSIETSLQIYAMEHNDFEGAKRVHEAQIAKDPKNPNVYNNFALFYRELGEPARAVPLLMQALSLYPKGNDVIFDNLGSAYLALGDNDAAIEWLLKGVDGNTQLLETYWGLAMAYSNKGDRPNASRYVAEYQRRADEQGFKGIQSISPPPETAPAYLKYFNEHFLPEWKRAGLP
jgi:TolB-like protein